MNKNEKLNNYKNFLNTISLTRLKAIKENLQKRVVHLRQLSNQADKEGRKNNFLITLSEMEQKNTWAFELIQKKTPGKLVVEMVAPFTENGDTTLFSKKIATYKDLLETFKSYTGSFAQQISKKNISNKTWVIRLHGTENYIQATLAV